MNVEIIRAELQRLRGRSPFRPFVIALRGGERVVIQHAEAVAFDPRPAGIPEFVAFTGGPRCCGSLVDVTGVTPLHGNEDG